MHRSLLGLIVCPRCRERFTLDVYREAASAHGGEPEILEGALACSACAAAYPVVAGVPRLLGPALLVRVRERHPQFFATYPQFLGARAANDDPLADTLESFTRQRLDLDLPGPALAAQWRRNLRRNLGDALTLDQLRGRRILDVGCGFGRHLLVAAEHGAEVVGVDLSGGVEVAYRNLGSRPNCHIIQANVHERPLRDATFDVVWSFGVLHHMPDPAAGFRALVEFARPDGGLIAIWVYGYRGMSFTYRLSHMRALHTVTRSLSGSARLRASAVVAAVLSALYWEPLRVLRRLGLGRVVERMPLSDYVAHGWMARVAGVHDRLSTPITHFHDREELEHWLRAARLASIRVEDTGRRGWRASGRRVPHPGAASRPHTGANGPGRHEGRPLPG
ncbi:MAG: class I SAM-dependent methyltransferase [Deltaproteobacteria bacterium]|nr:class I SAM-dependent methyltransferase [Deltaproteobacteria bacterium]